MSTHTLDDRRPRGLWPAALWMAERTPEERNRRLLGPVLPLLLPIVGAGLAGFGPLGVAGRALAR